MKKYWILLLVFFAVCGTAARAADAPQNFPINVHVTRSQWNDQNHSLAYGMTYQTLNVVIGGKKFKLEAARSSDRSEVLKIGDYKAALETTMYDTACEISETYVFLLPNGKTRKFAVVGESE